MEVLPMLQVIEQSHVHKEKAFFQSVERYS